VTGPPEGVGRDRHPAQNRADKEARVRDDGSRHATCGSPPSGEAMADGEVQGRRVERWLDRWGRRLVAVLIPMVVLAGACGDDDDGGSSAGGNGGGDGGDDSAAVCDARADLDASVNDLSDVDVAAEGTNALDAALGEVGDDVQAVADAAQEDLSDEVDDVQQAYDQLETAVDDFGDQESTSSAVAAVSGAVTGLAQATGALSEALAQECGED
jgi:hypothetical protein